uniref:Uncharacterized protein n=1 Tax=Rhizophora mucronata TaxID=61149 RepID=A0A2P2NL46_RHIMU
MTLQLSRSRILQVGFFKSKWFGKGSGEEEGLPNCMAYAN